MEKWPPGWSGADFLAEEKPKDEPTLRLSWPPGSSDNAAYTGRPPPSGIGMWAVTLVRNSLRSKLSVSAARAEPATE